MIARLWRGWTTAADADAYENFLLDEFLPGLKRIEGYCGAQVLRRDEGPETAFVTLTFFDTPEAIARFAGPDPELAHVAPRARELLLRYEPRATHYSFRGTAPFTFAR